MLRTYAQVVGVVLLVLGLGGLLLGDRQLAGALNIDLVEDIVHIVTGGLLAYAGFGRVGAGQARSVVIGVGALYLLLGLLGFVDPTLFGLLPSGYTVIDNFFHLLLGIAGLAIGYGARSAARTRRR